ncbi:FxsA family protein [Halobiforma nitratireducens]|uniref:Phage T7 F exclusion suppressor FxsA n=1 Tax=Halobiforma nitratireducens JCM 10879 TaxID=1227454 RepID=M0M777_9EURY|nr:FxsA family protein [Halobiforma nitratireducens]EMA41667.1 phage T7 F exclusion suppressor FxsA [Halobiforma nitratireducens JCM 10879]
MLRWIFALLLIPFLDAVLLAVVVSQTGVIGWAGMVLLVVLTGLVGMLLVRAEGRRTIRKMQRSLAQGTPPTNELLDGGLLIASGAFLLTPGLVTDLIGFLLVVPLTRIPIRMVLKRYVIVPQLDKKTGGFASGVVWTHGFPDDEAAKQAGFGGASGKQGGQDRTRSRTADGTYDLGSDAYTVDTGSSASTDADVQSGTGTAGSVDGTSIDLEDDSSDSDDGDDPAAR